MAIILTRKLSLHLLAASVLESHREIFLLNMLNPRLLVCRLRKNIKTDEDERKLLRKIISTGKIDYIDFEIFAQLFERKAFIFSKRDAAAVSKILILNSYLDDSKFTPEFLLYSMSLLIPNYDRKNISHYIRKISNFITVTLSSIGNLYSLKRQEKFLEICSNMEAYGLLGEFRKSVYYNHSTLTPDSKSVGLFRDSSTDSNDYNESMSFMDFKLKRREALGEHDSYLLKKILLKGFPHAEKIQRILMKNKISSFKFMLMLEHIMYVAEALDSKLELDEKYLERCLISLYK
jgi:hypothetical protein